MTIDNLSAVAQACVDAGHTMVVREREIRPGVRIAIVADPDGNWVEFLQLA
jgi:predicted enzyme related to lactoylglutathione lyase